MRWTIVATIQSSYDNGQMYLMISTKLGRNGAINLQSEALKRDWTITSILYFLPNCNLTDTLSSSLLELKNKGRQYR